MTTSIRKEILNTAPDEPRKSLAEIAYDELKIRILTLEFEPGAYLNESTAAKLLDMGRNPIHNAVKRLVFENLIEIIPRKGMIIKPIQIGDILEIAEARIINEAYCARKAAEKASAADIQDMRRIIDESHAALKANDTKTQMFLDRDFHCAIFKAAGNSVLENTLQILHDRSLRNWFTSLREPAQAAEVYEQHCAILAALEVKDPDGAEQQMVHHIEASRAALMRRF